MAEEKEKNAQEEEQPVTSPIPEPPEELPYEEVRIENVLDNLENEPQPESSQVTFLHEITIPGQGDLADAVSSPESLEDAESSRGHKQRPPVMGRAQGVRGEPERTPGPPDGNEPPSMKT